MHNQAGIKSPGHNNMLSMRLTLKFASDNTLRHGKYNPVKSAST